MSQMDDARKQALIECYRDGLLTDTIPFWTTHAPDEQHGGFFTALNRDGSVMDTDKSVWHQGRFTWMLGELYNTVEPNPEWLQLAKGGADFLEQHCFDESDGRMWFHVTREGKPIRKRRYAFSEAFAAIGFGEVAKATSDSRYAELAEQCFRKFIRHGLDPQGVEPKFTEHRPMVGIGFPMIVIGIAQELRESIQLADADGLIDEAMDHITRLHMKPDLKCVLETVGPDGEIIDHLDGRLLNPGHAIEAAWFVLREAEYRGDQQLLRTGLDTLDWMWEWGWDEEYGGILYFRDLRELPPQEYWHDMKFWWPQNEAIIATLYAYKLTQDAKYADWHRSIHDWAHQRFIDKEFGEWYGYLHRDGRVSQPAKGNLWKGCFHLPRMQLVCWKLVEAMTV